MEFISSVRRCGEGLVEESILKSLAQTSVRLLCDGGNAFEETVR